MKLLFRPGDRVLHRKFGQGIVEKLSGSGADTLITIRFENQAVREFVLSIAPIIRMEE